MSDHQENNQTKSAQAQNNSFAQFKKPTVALVIIVVFVSLARLYTPPNQQKKTSPANKLVTTETTSPSQTGENTAFLNPASQPQSPPVTITNTEVPSPDNERLNELEEKIVKLQAAHEEQISELKAKFAEQNAAAQSKANSMLSALVAFGQLKDAIIKGNSYESELNQLLRITSGDEDVQEILSGFKGHSETGIITPALLKEKFPPLARQAIFSREQNSYKNILHKFITIRKTGDQAGSDDESIIARAEFKLAHDDLKGALNELASLSQTAQPVFAGWSQDARDWLNTQEKLASLQLLITQTEIAPQP